MADTLVILGGFVFQGWEIPERVSFGGKQMLAVHKLIGGDRVVDAMGADPSDISWGGRFRGPDSIGRAQAVDAMRIAGQAVALSWLGIVYTVVISEFKATTERFYEVPYSIVCTVVNDPGQAGAAGPVSGLDSLVGGDLGIASTLAAAASSTTQAAVSGLQATVSAAGALQNASQSTLGPLFMAAKHASFKISSDIDNLDGALNDNSKFAPGTAGGTLAQFLTGQQKQMLTQSAAVDTLPYVQRVGMNFDLNLG